MVLMPLVTKRQPGRRRKNRIPSIGEFSVSLLFVDTHNMWRNMQSYLTYVLGSCNQENEAGFKQVW